MKSVNQFPHQILIPSFLAIVFALSTALPTPAQQQIPPDPGSDVAIGNTIFLPLLVNSETVTPTFDLSINHIQITQAIQTTTNSVPMVRNRATAMRIFASTNDSSDTTGVTVSLNAYRNGTLLSGSPLNLGPGTVSRSPSYSDLNSTFNTLLPSNWLSGNVTFVATVDSDLVVPETDEGNNEG